MRNLKLWQTGKLFLITCLLFIFLTSLCAGKKIRKIGKYNNVEILKVTKKGIQISHADGICCITEDDLSDGYKKILSAEIEQYHKLKSSHIAHVKKLRKQQTEQLIEKNKDKLANLIRQEAERQEAERLEAERREAERQEAERQEAERQEAERQEAELRRKQKQIREQAKKQTLNSMYHDILQMVTRAKLQNTLSDNQLTRLIQLRGQVRDIQKHFSLSQAQSLFLKHLDYAGEYAIHYFNYLKLARFYAQFLQLFDKSEQLRRDAGEANDNAMKMLELALRAYNSF